MSKTTATTNKTPYEIRLELLQMAQNHFQNLQAQQHEFAVEYVKKSISAGVKTAEAMTAEVQKLMPRSFTVEDIIAKANQMYSFIQKKD